VSKTKMPDALKLNRTTAKKRIGHEVVADTAACATNANAQATENDIVRLRSFRYALEEER
jgi:hypothetical protein